MSIVAAVDGSALSNPGPAGWCWYIDETTWDADGWPEGTNNRGELTAVEKLLEATAHVADEPLHILCDSQYVINSVTKWMPGWKRKGWKKKDGKPVLNVDILKSIDALLVGRNVTFEWVKGHAGHDMNEAADDHARAAATAYQNGTKVPTGPGFPGASRRNPSGDAAYASAVTRSQSSPASASNQSSADYVQDGLFDMPEVTVDKREQKAKSAHATLQRAVARAHDGDSKRLAFLCKEAALYPASAGVEAGAGAKGIEKAFPEDFADVKPEMNVVGETVAMSASGDGWHSLTVWDVSGDAKLVAHHLAK